MKNLFRTKLFLTVSCLAAMTLLFAGSASAALFDRGAGFIYDDVLDITWTQDANMNSFDTWPNQVAWAASLSIFDTRPGAGGVTYSDWRLPTTLQPDASCDSQFDPPGFPTQGFGGGCTGSEMGHLFNVDGISASSPGLFTNVQSLRYWSGTEYAPTTPQPAAWVFSFGNGLQSNILKSNDFPSAWAVRPGDVAVVPVPAAVWLFGSALGLLGWLRRRRVN